MNQRILDLHVRDLKAAHALQVAALEARIRQLERENRLLCRRNTKLETHKFKKTSVPSMLLKSPSV